MITAYTLIEHFLPPERRISSCVCMITASPHHRGDILETVSSASDLIAAAATFVTERPMFCLATSAFADRTYSTDYVVGACKQSLGAEPLESQSSSELRAYFKERG